jgi:nucleotide-binding universal stress UspA family protein
MPLENTDAGDPADEVASTESTSSIEDTIRASYREAMARGEAEDGETVETDVSSATEGVADGRARGPDGKFIKADDKPNSVGAKPNSVAEEVKPPVGEPQQQVQVNTNPDNLTYTDASGKQHAIDISKPPNGWRSDAKAAFTSLPEIARREIHKREDDLLRGVRQYRDAAGFGSQMAQELMPYQETINKHGIHPREIVKTLGNAWNTLVGGTPDAKRALLLQIAKDYDINIGAATSDATQQSTAAPQVDPLVSALQQELKEVKGYLTTQERQRAEAEFSAKVDEVTQWGSAAGADGKQLRPHFEALREDMAVLIETGRAKDLQDAYDKAQWINPEIRSALLAEQEKERAEKAARDAAAARKAAGANVTRRGTPPVSAKPGKVEDTIRKLYRERQG